MLRNILLYDVSYDYVSPSNYLSYDMWYNSIKQYEKGTIDLNPYTPSAISPEPSKFPSL